MPAFDLSRYALWRRLDEVLGSEEAMTLLRFLPPESRAQVAPNDDSAAEQRPPQPTGDLEARIEVLASRLEARLLAAVNRMMVITIWAMVGLGAVVVAAIKV